MYDILEEFYRGGIIPHEHRFPKDSRYKSASEKADESRKKLLDNLSEEQLRLFDDFENASYDLMFISDVNQFNYSFQLGALMGIEIMEGKQQILEDNCR